MALTFSCVFQRVLMTYDEQFGDLLFLVRPYRCAGDLCGLKTERETVVCRGRIQPYPKWTPLKISGTPDKNGGFDNGVLLVDSCAEEVSDADQAVRFLSSPAFPGVGAAAASKIYAACRDPFAAYAGGTLKPLLSETEGLNDSQRETVYQKIRSITECRKFMEFVVSKGGTCRQARLFFRRYGADSAEVVDKNPYTLRAAEVPFPVYDAIAEERGIGVNDDRRTEALIGEAFRNAKNDGDSYLTLQQVFRKAEAVSRRARKQSEPLVRFHLAAVLHTLERYYRITEEPVEGKRDQKECRIYPLSVYEEEENAASHFSRLEASAVSFRPRPEAVEAIEKQFGVVYAEKQKEAFRLVERTGAAILTGGPGTGKTTVERGLIAYYEMINPGGSIALCAPTAAAAKRMQAATGRRAVTIHKLLEVRPDGYGGYQCRNEYNRLKYDFIIVDEFSMVDLTLFEMLVKAVKNGALVLFVGDRNQLASVGIGNVMKDLLGIPSVRRVELREVYRQSSLSSLTRNSFHILEGRPELIETDRANVFAVFPDTDRMRAAAAEYMSRWYRPDNPSLTRLFCTSRDGKFPLGTESMNRMFREFFHGAAGKGKPEETLIFGSAVFSKGDPVVFTRNNYAMGYFNGDEGTVEGVRLLDSGRRALVIRAEEDTFEISGAELADVSLAYATTVHRAQGSECDTAIILLPNRPKSLLRNDLLYVAATRAKKRNIYIVQSTPESGGGYPPAFPNAFCRAAKTKEACERKSGLTCKISAALQN